MEINWLVIFTTWIFTASTWMYILETLKWNTKPNRVGWLIWALAPLIWAAAMFVSEWFIWPGVTILMMWLMNLAVVWASFLNKNAYWKLQKLDYFSFGLALIGLGMWAITSDPLLALICAIAVDGIGGALMLKKLYTAPETENISISWMNHC